MTSAVLDRPRQPAHRTPPSASNFTGTLALLRLYLRRDRIVAPLWILLLSVPLAGVYVGSTDSVYPTRFRLLASDDEGWGCCWSQGWRARSWRTS